MADIMGKLACGTLALAGQIMHMLYDSDTFAVMYVFAHPSAVQTASADEHSGVPQMPRHGFEIVDKRSGKELYLDGSWAELFQQQIQAWQLRAPTQEEVEDTLEGYATLAQTPLSVH